MFSRTNRAPAMGDNPYRWRTVAQAGSTAANKAFGTCQKPALQARLVPNAKTITAYYTPAPVERQAAASVVTDPARVYRYK